MAETAIKNSLHQEFMAVPANMVAEIIRGALVTHPRPAPKHARAASVLGGKLGDPFDFGNDGPGGWAILDEPELHLGDDILVPDLAGWRRENMPRLPDTAYFETPPDWICEVISPSTARYDRVEKRQIYASHVVRHLWHLDPDAQLLEAFELRDGNWLLLATFSKDDEVAAAPFDAVPFSLGALWFEESKADDDEG